MESVKNGADAESIYFTHVAARRHVAATFRVHIDPNFSDFWTIDLDLLNLTANMTLTKLFIICMPRIKFPKYKEEKCKPIETFEFSIEVKILVQQW